MKPFSVAGTSFVITQTGQTYVCPPGVRPVGWFAATFNGITTATHRLNGTSSHGRPFFAELTSWLQSGCSYEIVPQP